MNRKLLAVACALAVPPATAQHEAHWSYQGRTGAAQWGNLDPDFKTCKLGKHQSPINIDTRKVEKTAKPPLVFSYKSEPAEVVNTGHTILVNLRPGSSVTIDGQAYQLMQFHFHTPSEEKFDGKGFPMVAHLVHKNAEGKLAAVAVLIEEGRENAALKPVFDNMPSREGETKALPAPFDPAGLLPLDHAYYAYTGSLTTPPCSEDLQWRILKTPIEISPAQFAQFTKLYKMDARPVQPLNDRVVETGQ